MTNLRLLLPQTSEEVAILKPAVEALLNRIPEKWEPFDFDALSAIEQRALQLLTLAGMVERRTGIRVWMVNHSFTAEAEISATGERGLADAMQVLLTTAWAECRPEWEAWHAANPDLSPFCSAPIGTTQWRLTDQGPIARCNLVGQPKDRAEVFDFVLWQNFFAPDGPWRTGFIANGLWHEPRSVHGSGKLMRITRSNGDPITPQEVNIANWEPGSQLLAEAIAKALGAVSMANQPKPNDLARHSPDFASVNWFGTPYVFSGGQAACVKLLWEAWENGTPVITQAYIQETADVNSELRIVFREHSAWGTMIIQAGKGLYRLSEPNG